MRVVVLALLLMAAGWGAAPARAAPGQAAAQACRADARKLCRDVEPGGGRIVQCLRSHQAELSPGCAAELGSLERCADQLRRLCGDARGSALRQCAESHKEALAACPLPSR